MKRLRIALAIAFVSCVVLCTSLEILSLIRWLNFDGNIYLTLAEAYLAKNWATALQPYWSPLFPWYLAAVVQIFRPSPEKLVLTVRLAQASLLFLQLACYLFFVQSAGRYFLTHWRGTKSDEQNQHFTLFFDLWAYVVGLIALLSWTCGDVTPDCIVNSVFFLIMALFFRWSGNWNSSRAFCWGALWGMAFLAKTALLPVAIVSFIIAHFRNRKVILFSLLGLSTVSAPYICAISISQGKFTIGESGRINYLKFVQDLNLDKLPSFPEISSPYLHWIPGDTPLLQISDDTPIVHKLEENPALAFRKASVQFNLAAQAKTIWNSFKTLFHMLAGHHGAILFGVFLLLLGARKRISAITKHLRLQPFPILAVFVGALGTSLYTLVLVEPRYVTAFMASCVLILGGVLASESDSLKKQIFAAAFCLCIVLSSVFHRQFYVLSEIRTHQSEKMSVDEKLACILHDMPAQSLQRIGAGSYYLYDNFWLRLINGKISTYAIQDMAIGATPQTPTAAEYQRVVTRMLDAGVQIILDSHDPQLDSREGWIFVEGTNLAIYLVPELRKLHRARECSDSIDEKTTL